MSKKVIALILSLALILTLCPAFSLTAGALTSGDYTYEVLEGGNAVITGYDGIDSLVEIPSVIDGHTVISIGDFAFSGNYYIEEIIIPNTVRSIGYSAFANSFYITSLVIPEGVVEIGDLAFSGLSRVFTIHIPQSVTTIGTYAFGYLFKSNQYVPITGFVIYGYEDTAAQEYAENNCIFKNEGITSGPYHYIVDKYDTAIITGYEGDEEIVEVPDEIDGYPVYEIGEYAFAYCDGIQEIIFPDSIFMIDDYALFNCTYISSVTLPEELIYIGDYAFANIVFLTSLYVPRSVIYLGNYSLGAFLYADPDTGEMVTEMGTDFFSVVGYPDTTAQQYANYYKLNFEPMIVSCGDYDYVLLNDGTVEITGYYGEEPDLTLPETLDGYTVSGVRRLAFQLDLSLETLHVPANIKKLATGAFYGCINLKKVTFSEGITEIGALCFQSCHSLKELQLPRSLKTLYEYSFGFYDYYVGDQTTYTLDEEFSTVVYYDTVGMRYCNAYGIPCRFYTSGDIDKDGKVDIFDASSIQKSIAGTKGYVKYSALENNSAEFLIADVDGNGTVNIFDASLIQKNVAGSITAQGYGIGETL